MISEEQTKTVKSQLIQHINNTFPEDKKESAISQLQAMSSEELEQFLKQNNMIQAPTEKIIQNSDGTIQQSPQTQQCIFCSIASNQMPSHKIDENKQAVAVLELNPISKGHSIIIPKKHIQTNDKIPQQAFSLAKKIAKKLKSKLKPAPQDAKLLFSNMFGHEIINVLPIYKNETLASERHKESEEELKKLQNTLEKKSSKTKTKIKKTKKVLSKKPVAKKKNLWLPRRIP